MSTHLPGWSAALNDDHTLLVWDPAHRLLNAGALRPDRVAPETVPGAKDNASTSSLDISQRVHGVGDRLTAYALDVYLQTWLETTAAA